MIHKANVPREVCVEEYYVLRGISDNGMSKRVIREKEFKSRPTIVDITQFLWESKADFVSVATNYRLIADDDLPFM